MYKVFLFNKAIAFVSPEELEAFEEPVPHIRFSDQGDLLQHYRGLVHDGDERKILYVVDEDPLKVWELFAGGFENVMAAGGVVMDPDERMLFILRNGRWDLPKGKVEEGEDIAEAARREVEEECGISIDRTRGHLVDSFHIYQTSGVEFLKRTSWYKMGVDEHRSPTPQLEEGITKAEWKGPDEREDVKRNTFASIIEVMRAAASTPVQ
ncbi:MAG: NUDIX domain-containing protein [Flavobacteriales bacterium]